MFMCASAPPAISSFPNTKWTVMSLCMVAAYMKPVRSLPMHTRQTFFFLQFNSVWFQVWIEKQTNTSRLDSSIRLQRTICNLQKPTIKWNTQTRTHWSRCCGEALGGTAHWGEANSLLRMPATFLQLHCHIASLLTRHYLGSCYCTALPRK